MPQPAAWNCSAFGGTSANRAASRLRARATIRGLAPRPATPRLIRAAACT